MVIFQYNLYIFGSIFELFYIQNHVITSHVIKRLKCGTCSYICSIPVGETEVPLYW